jgi:hypothetical protein
MDAAAKRTLIKNLGNVGNLIVGIVLKNIQQDIFSVRKCVNVFFLSWSGLIYMTFQPILSNFVKSLMELKRFLGGYKHWNQKKFPRIITLKIDGFIVENG